MVHTRYYGETVPKLYCSNDEEIKAIISGELFKTESFTWYCRAVPFEARTNKAVSSNLVCLEKYCSTSRCTKQWSFVVLEVNAEGHIYCGEELEKKILKEVASWMKNINPKTKRAFSGKSFESYLNALPTEFMVDEKFVDKVKDVIRRGAVGRIKGALGLEEIKSIQELSKFANEVLNKNHKASLEAFGGKVEIAKQADMTLEEAKTKAIEELSKSPRKGK